jgi:hypothetical protein
MNKKAIEVIKNLLKHAPQGGTCCNFHHSKKDRHNYGEECPPLKRYQASRAEAESFLNDLKK